MAQAKEMYDFFVEEFENLKALTGFNQWEKMQESGADEINKVIDLLIVETKREPFRIVKTQVIQRIIHDAILNDGEFTGLNAKFVRKALNAWWGIYGQKILEARDQKGPEIYQPVKLSEEENARVNTLLESFKRSIQGGVFQQVPNIKGEEAAKQGAEWKSEVERKAVSTKIDPDRHIYTPETLKERNERIRVMQEKAFRDRNPGASEEEVKLFMETVKKHEVKIPKTALKNDNRTD